MSRAARPETEVNRPSERISLRQKQSTPLTSDGIVIFAPAKNLSATVGNAQNHAFETLHSSGIS